MPAIVAKAMLSDCSATCDKSRDGLMRHWSRDLHEMSQTTKIGDRVGLGFEYANEVIKYSDQSE